MYNNPYVNMYSPQANIDRINNQIAELEKMKSQIPQNNQLQHPSINQTFQLAPNTNYTMRFANTVDEVNKEIVTTDTPFFSKDMSVVWIKNTKGEIKTYELKEIVARDDKDLLIASLQMQMEELRKEVKANAKPINDDADEPDSSKEPSNVSNGRASKKKQ